VSYISKYNILLSLSNDGGENYFKAFSSCGFNVSGGYLVSDPGYDALVLCGGGDIDPSYFGEENRGSNPPDRRRDKSEFSLFEKYISQGKPVMGICRGVQLINVAAGGRLYQHLKSAKDHMYSKGDMVHSVTNIPGSPAHMLYGDVMTVNSAHHQGCRDLGSGLRIMQKHTDGTIEGIYGFNIIGVQWHPERMTHEFMPKYGKFADPSLLFKFFMKMMEGKCKL
jgi:putative glutamine amidotransferase